MINNEEFFNNNYIFISSKNFCDEIQEWTFKFSGFMESKTINFPSEEKLTILFKMVHGKIV